MRIEASIQIERPVEEVFDFVRRFENIPLWVPPVRQARQLSEGAMGVGTKGVEFLGPFGKGTEVIWEVTEYEPNVVCAFRSQTSFLLSRLNTEARYSFRPLNGRTELHAVVETEVRGLVTMIRPIFQSLGQRNREGLLRNIKTQLEGG